MYKEIDERELARRCSMRDRMAADELYRRYAAKVYTLCRRYMGDGDESKDLMQDAMLQAIDKIQTYKYTGEGSLFRWIRRIAINKALNQIRRRKWRTVSLDFKPLDFVEDPKEEDMAVVPQEKLIELIASLPDLRRSVFNLHCIDGYSHKEISKRLGISENGSASVLVKAKRQLKEKISRYIKESER